LPQKDFKKSCDPPAAPAPLLEPQIPASLRLITYCFRIAARELELQSGFAGPFLDPVPPDVYPPVHREKANSYQLGVAIGPKGVQHVK
jgi:hypothetical protein